MLPNIQAPRNNPAPSNQDAKTSATNEAEHLGVPWSHRLGQVILLIIWIPLIRVFGVWLSYPLAAGISSLTVILIAYRFQSKHKRPSFARWAGRGMIYAAIITAVAYIVSSIL